MYIYTCTFLTGTHPDSNSYHILRSSFKLSELNFEDFNDPMLMIKEMWSNPALFL